MGFYLSSGFKKLLLLLLLFFLVRTKLIIIHSPPVRRDLRNGTKNNRIRREPKIMEELEEINQSLRNHDKLNDDAISQL